DYYCGTWDNSLSGPVF
nr:immunoglobulin light chain junction region [Macaca mulatta]MOW69727.1 immunoglobulin light chain junction region [Macaca mulatta]